MNPDEIHADGVARYAELVEAGIAMHAALSRRDLRRCRRRGHPMAYKFTSADGSIDAAWCTCGLPIDRPDLAGLPPRIRRRVLRLRGEA